MLRVCDIDVFYGDAQALGGVSIDVAEGQIIAIVGANGAGKTSLIRTIAGMQRPARGRIRRAESLARVFAMFPILSERDRQAAGTLSGGEQQMLAIGRCLMGRPDLVMFDEPSLGLAPAIVQEVLKTIRELNRDGLTCILVEQNVAVSLRLADRAYVLENGRITLTGTGAELLADDRVRQAYLGM